MTKDEIIAIQKKIGTTPDGFWGPKSITACQKYLRSLMPKSNPWPKTSELTKFYGLPGDESQLVEMEFPYPTFYDGKRVLKTRVHKKCKDSLIRVLTAIGTKYGGQKGIMEEAEDYGGIYNNRNKRGGTTKSLHAYGAAIDLDADDNTFKDSWPLQSDMSFEIIEEFAREGWISAAAFWGYDAMHFQATQ